MVTLQIPFSISFAATIRIGNELGAGNTRSVKRVFYISLIVAGKVIERHIEMVTFVPCNLTTVCEALVLAVAIQALKYQIGIIFTNDE